MAIENFVPEFFAQELSPLEMPLYPRMALAGQLSVGVGNALSWPDLEGNISVSDYTDGAAVTYAALTDKVYKVSIADFKHTAWKVTDIERALRIPSAMAQGMSQSMREQRVELENALRAAFRNTDRLAASGLSEPTRAGRTALKSNVRNLELLHTAGSGNAHPKWGTTEAREAIVKEIQQAANYMRRHFWPAMGKATVPLEIYNELLDFLVFDKPNLGQGAIVDSALTGGKVPMFYGIEIIPEPLVGVFNTGGVVGANAGLRLDYHYPGQSAKYILKMVTAETFRDNNRMQDDGRTLWLHGAGQDAARFLYSTTIQLSAS